MNLKSIMLGTAAAIVAAPAAFAADMPMAAPVVAVDYVKVCDTFSTGFFYIPGTDTCLRISGRVRVIGDYDFDEEDFDVEVDGRVDFDARTMTEYGMLRSFIRIEQEGGGGADSAIRVGDLFIQLGYVTVGRLGAFYNGDRLYGHRDAANDFMGDAIQVRVVVDDLGGGFFVGAQVGAHSNTFGLVNRLNAEFDDVPDFTVAAGISDQPWGDVAAYFFYSDESSTYAIKGIVNLKFGDLGARLTAAYVDDQPGIGDAIELSAAASYAFGAAAVYAGVAYDFNDDVDDDLSVNLGVDYTVTPGLNLLVEGGVEDADEDFDSDDAYVLTRLTRTF